MERVINIIPYFLNRLKGCATNNEITNWAYLSIENVLGLNRSDCILQSELKLSKEVANRFVSIVDELIKSRPIQHIIGEVKFCGFNLKVDHSALIPRPETEELVDWLINDNLNIDNKKRVIDLCTGSGCIGISIDINNNYLDVTISDISNKALKVCEINKKNLNSKVKIIELDLNLISRENKKYDIIISNPPYIPPSESDLLDKNVKYEPDIALFTPKDNPLHFYEKIFEFASLNLSNNGIIYLEINPNFIKEFNQLLTNYSVNHVNFKNDFRGKKRLVKVIF